MTRKLRLIGHIVFLAMAVWGSRWTMADNSNDKQKAMDATPKKMANIYKIDGNDVSKEEFDNCLKRIKYRKNDASCVSADCAGHTFEGRDSLKPWIQYQVTWMNCKDGTIKQSIQKISL